MVRNRGEIGSWTRHSMLEVGSDMWLCGSRYQDQSKATFLLFSGKIVQVVNEDKKGMLKRRQVSRSQECDWLHYYRLGKCSRILDWIDRSTVVGESYVRNVQVVGNGDVREGPEDATGF